MFGQKRSRLPRADYLFIYLKYTLLKSLTFEGFQLELCLSSLLWTLQCYLKKKTPLPKSPKPQKLERWADSDGPAAKTGRKRNEVRDDVGKLSAKLQRCLHTCHIHVAPMQATRGRYFSELLLMAPLRRRPLVIATIPQ